jgi:alcohol dehydrogenase
LRLQGIVVIPFHDFATNPDTSMVERGRSFAVTQGIDSIVALGGGSSMDCAKGINFVLTNGGRMQDYWGYGKATQPLLPMIGVPTTSGTGSEAQSYALISDVETHVKMACGDPKAAFRVAILDPELTVRNRKQ